MRRRRRYEPRWCPCGAGHLEGLPRATRARRGELVEPGATVSLHFGRCVHSCLESTTNGETPETAKRVPDKRRPARRIG